MINREDFKLFYNENICVLYIVPSNKLLTMNANKAPLFEMQLNNYFAKNSSAGDAERIEEFLNRSLDEEPSNDDKDLFHYRHLRKLEILLTNHCNLSCRYCYEELRKKIQSVNRIEHPVCKRCWAKYLCNACPASLLLDRQGSEAEMKKNCPIIREKIKNILLMIAEDSSKNQLLNYERSVED